MPRAKGGVVTHRRHKKSIKQAKGHRGLRHKVFRRANESVLHALRYAYEHRRDRKGAFRRLWIQRINAEARLKRLSHQRLAHIDVRDEAACSRIAETAKSAIGATAAA